MSFRSWVVRRAMGRFRITDDIVRYLSTFQRLGETVEVQVPGELLPIGARTVFRAIRTRAAAQIGVDWVWPYWLERQLDPRSPAFIPRGHLPVLTNVTRRNWTAIGTPERVAEQLHALQDELGLDGILAELNTGGQIPHDCVLNALRLLCSEVMPRFH